MSASQQPVFEVRLRSKRVQREVDALRGADYERVVVKLRAVANAPRPEGCEKLYATVYRVRAGDFRIVYLLMRRTSVLKWGEFAAGPKEPKGNRGAIPLSLPASDCEPRLVGAWQSPLQSSCTLRGRLCARNDRHYVTHVFGIARMPTYLLFG